MRNSLKIAVLILCTICLPFTGNAQQTTGKEDRAFWVENLTRIADPVLVNLSNNTLKKNMPYESLGNRRRFSHLEAVAVWSAVSLPGWNWDRTIRRKASSVRNIST